MRVIFDSFLVGECQLLLLWQERVRLSDNVPRHLQRVTLISNLFNYLEENKPLLRVSNFLSSVGPPLSSIILYSHLSSLVSFRVIFYLVVPRRCKPLTWGLDFQPSSLYQQLSILWRSSVRAYLVDSLHEQILSFRFTSIRSPSTSRHHVQEIVARL
jgi:hypothetical protein